LSTDELEFEDYSGHVMPKGVTNIFTFDKKINGLQMRTFTPVNIPT
jgi:hypothetical protein